jgi:predicted RNA binding protein YcfA (HicA-like mRNA interferase family)
MYYYSLQIKNGIKKKVKCYGIVALMRYQGNEINKPLLSNGHPIVAHVGGSHITLHSTSSHQNVVSTHSIKTVR